MIKMKYLFFILILLSSSTLAQRLKSNAVQLGLKGKVRLIREDHDGRDSNVYVFNKKGNFSSTYTGYGKTGASKDTFIYDSRARLIELDRRSFDFLEHDTTELSFKFSRLYNSHNKIIYELEINDQGDGFRRLYAYDSKGRTISWDEYKISNDTLLYSSKHILEYNTKGKLIGEKVYYANYHSEYKYDKGGKITEQANYDTSGICVYKTSNQYDEHGSRIKWETYRLTGLGECAFQYQYDSKGNWIKRTSHIANQTDETTIRSIIYY